MKKSLLLLLIAVFFSLSQTPQARAQNAADIVPKREKLLNGLPVVMIERPGSGSVAFHLVVKSGSTFDVAGKAGLADVASQMLLRGSGGWTAERLKEELNDIGGRLEIKTGWDSTEIKLLGSGANVDGLIDILSRIVTQAKFRDDDFAQLKAERIKEIAATATPAAAAEETFYKTLYETHPYGHNIIGTKESIDQISRFDVSDFYERFFIANNSALVVVGEISAERVSTQIRRAFGGWRKGPVPPYTFVPPKSPSGVNIRLIERPDQQTAEVCLGSFALRRVDSDYLSLLAFTYALNERLAKSGVKFQAALSARKLLGPIIFSAGVPSKDAAEAISRLIAEIKRAGDGIDAAELQAVKDKMLQEHRSSLNANTDMAARWAELENYELGSNYLKNLESKIYKLSVEDLLRAGKRYLSAENLTVAVIGRASDLEPSLKKLGKVEIAGVPVK